MRWPSNDPNIRLIRQNALRRTAAIRSTGGSTLRAANQARTSCAAPTGSGTVESVRSPRLVSRVDARGDGKEAADHVADDQHQQKRMRARPEATDGMIRNRTARGLSRPGCPPMDKAWHRNRSAAGQEFAPCGALNGECPDRGEMSRVQQDAVARVTSDSSARSLAANTTIGTKGPASSWPASRLIAELQRVALRRGIALRSLETLKSRCVSVGDRSCHS